MSLKMTACFGPPRLQRDLNTPRVLTHLPFPWQPEQHSRALRFILRYLNKIFQHQLRPSFNFKASPNYRSTQGFQPLPKSNLEIQAYILLQHHTIHITEASQRVSALVTVTTVAAIDRILLPYNTYQWFRTFVSLHLLIRH